MTPKVLTGMTDLVLSARILNTAKVAEADVEIEKSFTGVLDLARKVHPDIVIIDLHCETLRPLELAHQLRQHEDDGRTKMIGVQLYLQRDLQEQALEAGFDYVITRPQLSARLAEILRGKLAFLERRDGGPS